MRATRRVNWRSTLGEYDRKMCKRRNEVERLFRRLKGFRRVFHDSISWMSYFLASSISRSLSMDSDGSVNRP